MTDKTKTILGLILGVIGLVLLFGGLICDIISDHWPNVLHESDWYEVMMIVGWPFVLLADYLRPVTTKRDMKNAGWNCFSIVCAMGFICIIEVFDIQHFTIPITVILIITALVAIPACVLNYRKWCDIKSQLEEQDNEKK